MTCELPSPGIVARPAITSHVQSDTAEQATTWTRLATKKQLLANRITFSRGATAERDRAGLRGRRRRRCRLPACVGHAAERHRDAARSLVVRAQVRRALRVVAVVV